MLAVEVEVSVGPSEEVVLADEQGANLVAVATMVPYLQHDVMARPEIHTLADLQGKAVG